MYENEHTPAGPETEETTALDQRDSPDPTGRLADRLKAAMGLQPVLIAGMVMGMAAHGGSETISTALL
ncbi:hypothetical protein ABTY20_09385 [Streptomyces sp. NPDC126497]|uniref:hypothetical protein n=1 Tax=Streptomyces sp. NPDC126497 TaxID=3155313 RepID=UPI00332D0071